MAEKSSPWKIYDELISEIPSGIAVTDFCLGTHWCYVDAGCGMGIAHTFTGGGRRTFGGDPRDCDLKEIALLAKSWNLAEASLGFAAINAWYSRVDAVIALGGHIDEGVSSGRGDNPFSALREQYAGKRVCVVGHFPNVEGMAGICDLTVLERNCKSDLDTPDFACEYVIPEQDFVFLTGTTLTNKTAPRLLQLAQDTFVAMVGPTTVPSKALVEAGVRYLGGSLVIDPEAAKYAVKGGSKKTWRQGIKKFSWMPEK